MTGTDAVPDGPARLTARLIAYIATKPGGTYVHDIAANVLGAGGYTELRVTLGNLTTAGFLVHTATGRDGVWADLWKATDTEEPTGEHDMTVRLPREASR